MRLTPRERKGFVVAVMIGLALVGLVTLLRWILDQQPRSAAVRGQPVDLSPGYNGMTTEPTTVLDDPQNQNTLDEFPLGENEFAGIRFMVGGVIQLNGRFPDRVQGVRLDRRCRRLHLLHGTAAKAPDGTTIARLVLNYASGAQAEVHLQYGQHVRDWWQRPGDPLPLPPLQVAWTGHNRLTRREGAELKVYLSTFDNPRPRDPIARVDFVSANTGCWPFFLGLTVD